jgi:hypothetical protein
MIVGSNALHQLEEPVDRTKIDDIQQSASHTHPPEQSASAPMNENRDVIKEWLFGGWAKAMFLRHGVELGLLSSAQANQLISKLMK